MPWAVLGDFNDIASSAEKKDGGVKDPKCILSFVDMIYECKLKTLSGKGVDYTWSNKRKEGGNVQEKIDRVLTNIEWIEKFPNSVVQQMPMVGSDHCLLVLQQKVKEKKARRCFKFESFWSEENECVDVVKENWKTDRKGSYSFKLMRKLRTCSRGLAEWSKIHFPNTSEQIEVVMAKLVELQNGEQNEENLNLI